MNTRDASLRDGFLSPAEFAEELSVSLASVQAWIRDGRLPAIRLGRITLIPKDALQRLLGDQGGGQ